jgi:hypothetical protein
MRKILYLLLIQMESLLIQTTGTPLKTQIYSGWAPDYYPGEYDTTDGYITDCVLRVESITVYKDPITNFLYSIQINNLAAVP